MKRLVSLNTGGNVHQSVDYINKSLPELIDGVISIEFNGGNHSVVLIRADEQLIEKLKKENRL